MKVSNLTAFLDLGLAEPIARALTAEGYEAPTPIQAQTIPQVLEGRDVVGIAQTGTGKTAAFALPILHHLAKAPQRPERKSCRVLVLSPTRELSSQIVDSFRTYGRFLRPSVALAIGGVPINRQIKALANGVDILVATPGRLIDLLNEKAVTLDRVEIYVLDEADRMLDMGFINDIRRIVSRLPANRQTLFFSATMPPPIEELGRMMLRDPARVAVKPAATTAERIAQSVILVEKAGKPALLAEVLHKEPIDRAIVFTRTKHGADKVVRQLGLKGLESAAIHGNKSQNQRERALAAFRTGRIKILIATDIAARGIDVDGVTHVVNYDLPNIPESYVHRIGRTARAGAEGVAISFCDHEERAYLRDIEKLIRMQLPVTDRRAKPADGPAGQPAAAGEVREANGHRHPRGEAHQDRGSGRGPGRNQGRNGQGRGPRQGTSEGRPAHADRHHANGGGQQAAGNGAGEGNRHRPGASHTRNGHQQRNGGTAAGELSSAGFKRSRRPDRRTGERPNAQAPR
jgi:ATP-dependent RNA helicase RhlE